MSELIKILSNIQRTLSAPKNQVNKFGGYNYRSCEDILEALKKVMPENAILTLEDEVIVLGDRFYIKATATFRVGEAFQKACAFAREPLEKKGSDASQITGAASSYARKYALNGLFMIDDSKDADHTNDHGKGDSYTKTNNKKEHTQNTKPINNALPPVDDKLKIVEQLRKEDAKLDAFEYLSTVTVSEKRAIWANLNAEQRAWVNNVMKSGPATS